MKVAGICGSPRERGNTAAMIRQVLGGAAAEGAETALCHLHDIDFDGCIACQGCKTDGACVLQDDLQSVLELIRASDALVFGSPIYFAEATGLSRCFMERLFYPRLGMNHQPIIDRNRNTVLVFCQGNPDLERFADTVKKTKAIFNRFGFTVIGTIVAAGGHSGDEVATQVDVMDRAKALGRKLVLPATTRIR